MAARSQTGRTRARESRIAAARERRQRLAPDQVAREQRIDEAAVDAELAWEARAKATESVEAAERDVAGALERLVAEKLTVAEVAALTGLDQATLRRLRQLKPAETTGSAEGHGSESPT